MSGVLKHILCVMSVVWSPLISVAEDAPREPLAPDIAAASDEGRIALQSFQIPAGWRGSLFAAEPMVANPVCFFVDHRGRVFVCESFRQNAGVTDNRGHDQAWLDDDLAAQTVADRLAYHRQHLGEKVVEYTQQDDRIRLLVDADDDGQADRATVFTHGYNRIVDGTGAGVIEHHGRVYYTCIPDLWLLRDNDGDGVADDRKSLHAGFGVRVAFRGHDMHGLMVGPDGRLYFSIGDRGYSVVTPEGRLHDPESGAVFRCELDGSNLEVFATGLRNPQELAFDNYGNLFTGDNNSDSGDKARWVYVVEGGDSGWRMAYQYLPDRGPFNRERIWHPYHVEQPAYIVPPVTNLADGPSGLAFDPGTGLPDAFRDRFYLCDFRGGPANSGIRSFRVQRRGAFFEVVDAEQPFWNILATDVQFGPDGALYVSDWVNGWNGEGKGRVYRFRPAGQADDPLVREVKSLLASGVAKLADDRLSDLMAHADRRLRMEAQFELVKRNQAARLLAAAQRHENLFARLHGLWGLGQLARSQPERRAKVADEIRALVQDPDVEVRAQTALLLGELGDHSSIHELTALLRDVDLRVRYFAARGLGKLRAVGEVSAVNALLAENADRDPIVRHGGIMALAGVQDATLLVANARHESPSVRRATVVALRRLRSPLVAEFLEDGDPHVVLEAARAIHDVPLSEALPKLAEVHLNAASEDALGRRVLNANYRSGEARHAQRLAAAAANAELSVELRNEALAMLGSWSQPSSRDRVLGMWRPLTSRSASPAVAALQSQLAAVLSGPSDVRAAGAQAARRLRVPGAQNALLALFNDLDQKPGVRGDALLGLSELNVDRLDEVVDRALQDGMPQVRAAGRQVLTRLRPQEGFAELAKAVRAEARIERQAALATLEAETDPAATAAIAEALEQLLAGKIPADTQLDVLEAARPRSSPRIEALLRDYEARARLDDPLKGYRETLVGGDVATGEKLFFERTEVSCVRCHKVQDRGGEVGPDLTRIAVDKTREYLLESIVAPNKTIAKGFESVVIVDMDGKLHTGVLKSQDENAVTIVTAEAKTRTISQSQIDELFPGRSPMPDDLPQKISKRELRDLIEYLASLKGEVNKAGGHER